MRLFDYLAASYALALATGTLLHAYERRFLLAAHVVTLRMRCRLAGYRFRDYLDHTCG